MDLAIIRKKFLHTPGEPEAIVAAAPVSAPAQLIIAPPDNSASIATTEIDLLQKEQFSNPATSTAANTLQLPERAVASCTPMESILAGRAAAGCDDETVLADDDISQVVSESHVEYLCFRVSDEIYGINIMDIKEIIKPREVTEVPRAPSFVSGVLSLRGMIIPIIDMRLRLGLAQNEPTGKERIIVIKNVNSLSGLMVDEVIQVVQVQHNDVEPAPPVLDGIDRDFIRGIGRSEGLLMIILNLENVADIHLY